MKKKTHSGDPNFEPHDLADMWKQKNQTSSSSLLLPHTSSTTTTQSEVDYDTSESMLSENESSVKLREFTSIPVSGTRIFCFFARTQNREVLVLRRRE